jgi:crossover junction endodeoxyribonuclease RusA
VNDLRVRLTLPYGRPPAALTANARPHWSARASDTRQVRSDVTRLAQAAGLHRYPVGAIEHITVELVWAPGDRRRRDAPNLRPLCKAAVDALARGGRKDLIGLDLVPDDTAEFVTELTPRIEPPPAKGMWLDLTIRLARAVT